MDTSPNTGAQPQYSPDGRWWWDGRQWLPTQPPPQPPQQSQSRGVPTAVWLIVAGLIVAFLAAAVVVANQADKQAEQDVNRIACERWGVCD